MHFSTTEKQAIDSISLSEFIGELPPLHAFVSLLLAHGYSQAEIAAELDMTPRNVRYIVAAIRARKQAFDAHALFPF